LALALLSGSGSDFTVQVGSIPGKDGKLRNQRVS